MAKEWLADFYTMLKVNIKLVKSNKEEKKKENEGLPRQKFKLGKISCQTL